MGYSTYFNGEGTYELDPFYEKCLQGFVISIFDDFRTIELGDGKIKFEGEYKDYNYVGLSVTQTIFYHLLKYGKITSMNISASGEQSHDVKDYVYKNGNLYVEEYDFIKDASKKITMEEVSGFLDEDLDRHEILSIPDEVDEDFIIETLDDFLDSQDKEIFLSNYDEIDAAVQKGLEFELYDPEGKIVFSKEGIFHIPFDSSSSVLFLNELEKEFESRTFKLDQFLLPEPTEKRTIQLADGNWYPLTTSSMVLYYPLEPRSTSIPDVKNVKLEDGKIVSPCEVCVNRIHKITGGCNVCVPNII